MAKRLRTTPKAAATQREGKKRRPVAAGANAVEQKTPRARALPPSITFVDGKWYNEHGHEVPRPQPVDVPLVAAAPSFPADVKTIDKKLRAPGCRCAFPANTGHVPGCQYYDMALYACEQGSRATVLALAKAAGSTVADLERRRIDFSTLDSGNGPSARCPDMLLSNLNGETEDPRRRCWVCPYWDRHEVTPFDHQPMGEY